MTPSSPLTEEERADWWRVVSDNPNHVVHRLIADLRAKNDEVERLRAKQSTALSWNTP